MVKTKRKLLMGVLTMLIMVSVLTGTIMAKGMVVDSEVMKILYEKTDNPESWVQFIADNADNGMGKWLPDLIKKVASTEGDDVKQLTYVTYKTVTRAYDWGPAIDKVVIDFGQALDGDTIAADMFSVKSIRNYVAFDFATFSFAEEAADQVAARTVTDAYLSDAEGNAVAEGNYVALEMAVGPNMTEGSPYNYNFISGRNEVVKTSYELALIAGESVKSSNGDALIFYPTTFDEKSGDIKVIADDFVNDQKYAQDGIELMYASFTPETASVEAGSNPLVIWLHGAGEGGTDTTVAIMGNEVVNLATPEYQAFFGETGAYILAPQSPTMWMDYDGTGVYNSSVEGSNGESYYTETLMGLIENFVASHPDIDTNRIYIGGCSNGGYMTVNMIMTYPEYFAAAYPICEAYSVEWITEDKIQSIKDLPVWLTHSIDDGVAAIAEGESNGFGGFAVTKDSEGNPILKDDFSNALYTRLVEAGSENVIYSRFDNVVDTTGQYFNPDGSPYSYMGHFSWVYTLNNECVEEVDGEEMTIFGWLGQQSK